MNAQDITEALLNINPELEKIFRAIHVVSKDRDWKGKAHPELNFIKHFYRPKFLVIISKQIHIYIIGDSDKGHTYHILNLEGYHADYMVISKKDLNDVIKNTVSEALFLPDDFYDRIIYINDIPKDVEDERNHVFVFNRVTKLNSSMFRVSKWTIGADVIYDVDNEINNYNDKNTNATKILAQIYDDCFK